MSEDKQVALLMFQTSVIVKGIEKNLTEDGIKVMNMVGDFKNLKTATDTIDVFIMYLPGEIADDAIKVETLKKITETITESSRHMIVIGEQSSQSDILREVPDIKDFAWINRPVDIKILKAEIERCFEEELPVKEKKKILVVDDDPAYAKMVREWIKDKYNVGIVTAGMQAITYLMKNKVDLVLLDYEMPVVDGPQVFQMLRSEPEIKDIPIMFLTGVGTREGVSRVLELKPNGYILKSTTKEGLLKSIKAQLDKR